MPGTPAATSYLNLPRIGGTDSAANPAATFNTILDGVDAFWGPWQTYGPIWAQQDAAVLNIGNGFMDGRYRVLGKFCYWNIFWQRGSTTNTGSSGQAWTWTLPPVTQRYWQRHSGSMALVRGATYSAGAAIPQSAGVVGVFMGGGGVLGNSVPSGTHTVGDWINMAGFFEIA